MPWRPQPGLSGRVCARDGDAASNPCPGFWQPPLDGGGEKLRALSACVGDGRGGEVGGQVGRVTGEVGWTSVSQGEATARPPRGVVQRALGLPGPPLWCPPGQPFCPRPPPRGGGSASPRGWMLFGDARVLRLGGSSRTQCGARAAQGSGGGACGAVCWEGMPRRGCRDGCWAPVPFRARLFQAGPGAGAREPVGGGASHARHHHSTPGGLLASGFAAASMARLGCTGVCTRPEVSRQSSPASTWSQEPAAVASGQRGSH